MASSGAWAPSCSLLACCWCALRRSPAVSLPASRVGRARNGYFQALSRVRTAVHLHITLPLAHFIPKCQKSWGALKKNLKNNGLGLLLWQIHKVNGWFPQIIVLLMEQREKKKACATGANDLSLKSVDVPEVPHAVRVLGGKNAHKTKPHQLLTKLLTK